MASPNNSSQLEAEPSKPRENNHFPRRNREVLSKRRKGKAGERAPNGVIRDQSDGEQVEKGRPFCQPLPVTVIYPFKTPCTINHLKKDRMFTYYEKTL